MTICKNIDDIAHEKLNEALDSDIRTIPAITYEPLETKNKLKIKKEIMKPQDELTIDEAKVIVMKLNLTQYSSSSNSSG
jgi:hypothetical protein